MTETSRRLVLQLVEAVRRDAAQGHGPWGAYQPAQDALEAHITSLEAGTPTLTHHQPDTHDCCLPAIPCSSCWEAMDDVDPVVM